MTHQGKGIDWNKMSELAWKAREMAFVFGNTKVGACVLSKSGKTYTGCNIEQTYRNKDIHAEVSSISNMILNGEQSFQAIIVVSNREHFTPCGSCLDWIYQFGSGECLVATQSNKNGEIRIYKAKELMPFYPH